MLNANELRIGNLILEDGKVVEVDRLDSEGKINQVIIEGESFNAGEIEPIQLKSEWLPKFGFTEDSPPLGFHKHHWYVNFMSDGSIYFGIDNLEARKNFGLDNQTNIAKIEYVHQLQNLYFAITQTELIYGDV